MKKTSLEKIIRSVNGAIAQGTEHLQICDLVTRLRKATPNSLFFDLYYDQNIELNHCPQNISFAVITDRPEAFAGLTENITIIKVQSIQDAYWKFVAFYRSLFDIPVIGVTGTCGKTTTKEMIRHILAASLKVNATYKSYNAQFRNLGYLLEIGDDTQAAVIEMGIALAGDLTTTCRYFRPQVGVITNIGVDHLQGFGTVDAYIEGKAEILAGLGFQGTLILNADDANIQKIDLRQYRGRVLYFGFSGRSDFKAFDPVYDQGVIHFSLQHNDGAYRFSIPGHGQFSVYNATAAIAAAHALGLPVETAGKRLASFQNVEKHFEINSGINGSTIIDDTWSTNPTSVAAALGLLKSIAGGKKTIAVLGKMSLLGSQSARYHYQTGIKVAETGVQQLIVVGESAYEIGRGALQKGMHPDQVFFCPDSAATYLVLRQSLDQDSIALVKTSMMTSFSDLMAKLIVKR